MITAVVARARPLAVALGALCVLGTRALHAQDTTRTDTTRARADTAHVRPDTTRIHADSLRGPADSAHAVRPDTPRVTLPLDTARRQIPAISVPPPVPPAWGFGLEIGFTDIAGNTDLQVFNGAFTTQHKRTTDYVLNTRVEARYGKSGGIVAAEYAAFKSRFDWRPHSGLSPFVEFNIESDQVAKYDARIIGGAGLNFNIAPREDRHTTLSAGLAAEVENRFASVVPNEVSDFRYTLRFNTQQPLNGAAVFELNTTLQPATNDLADYLWQSHASLKVTITKKLAFRTRYEWKRDSTPAPGVKPDDRTFTVSLAFSW